MLWLILVVITLVLIYYYQIRPINYWKNQGVIQGKPWPFFGDAWGTTFRYQSFAEMLQMVYNIGGPNARYCGSYQFMIPLLIIKDPELIRSIGVKDFEHFLDHRPFINEDIDPMWSKNLFALRGVKWREMRSTLSPTFTSSKMRQLYCLMIESTEQFINYFLKKQNNDLIKVEMKETFTRFANDVIATTAFGIKVDSLENPKNEFYLTGLEITNFTDFWKTIKFLIYFIFPYFGKLLKVPMFTKKSSDFFRTLVKDTIETREKNHIIRPDLINILMEARNNGIKYDENKESDAGYATVEESDVGKQQTINKKINLTNDDITAQALVFFFAGFDAISSLMSCASYELAVNPDIQKRLIEEVDEVQEKCQGTLTYEALLGMKYLDMVISETLRKWPNNVAVDRICTKPYTIQPINPDEKPLHLEIDTTIWLPIYGIHHDPRYWPEPERFDPERFNDENKSKIIPYTFIPFGVGPRNCIGSRFALLETKIVIFYLLLNFEFVPTEKTSIPPKISRRTFNINIEGGNWLGLKRRNKKFDRK